MGGVGMDCQGHRGNLLRVMENFYNIIILYTFVKIHQIIPVKLVHYVLKKREKNCTFLTIPLEYGECIVHQAFQQYFSLKKISMTGDTKTPQLNESCAVTPLGSGRAGNRTQISTSSYRSENEEQTFGGTGGRPLVAV